MPTPTPTHPLMIEMMRQGTYPGSDIVMEQTLSPGANYDRQVASYRSEGLRIYALLTVRQGERPETGWPVVVSNHGYIPPDQYRATERYVACVDGFARNGHIAFRPDHRDHADSEGEPSGAFTPPAYIPTSSTLSGTLRRYGDADPHRVVMWGRRFLNDRIAPLTLDHRPGGGSEWSALSRWPGATMPAAPTASRRPGSTGPSIQRI